MARWNGPSVAATVNAEATPRFETRRTKTGRRVCPGDPSRNTRGGGGPLFVGRQTMARSGCVAGAEVSPAAWAW